MLHREGTVRASSTNCKGDIRRQNQVWVVAGGDDAGTACSVVDERRGRGIRITDVESKCGFGGNCAFRVVGAVRQRAQDAGLVVSGLHYQVQAAGDRAVGVVRRGNAQAQHIRCNCPRSQGTARHVGVDVISIWRIAEVEHVGVDCGF